MKEKILALLTSKGGQYNLPKEILSSIADSAPQDLNEDKIESWVTGTALPQMALLQRYSDTRVTKLNQELEELKKKQATNSDKDDKDKKDFDLEKLLGGLEERINKTVEQKLSGYDNLKNQHEELLKKQQEIENAQKLKDFKELTKRVAKSVGMNDRMLNLVEGKLNAEMDEKKVTEVLSECKNSSC